jgi:hypothetical protein
LSYFNLKHLNSSKNLCRINSLFSLLFCPLVGNIILLVITIGAHRTRPPHNPAAAAPAGVGATSGSKAFGPSVGCRGCGYAATAWRLRRACAHPYEASCKYEKVQKGRE